MRLLVYNYIINSLFKIIGMKSNINFPYLIFLSVVAALGGFLFGYDAAVISGTVSQVTS